MRVLLIGAGGREHALAVCLAASPLLGALFVAPGNPGTASVAENVPLDPLDIPSLVAFARAQKIDLVVPGPEAPLVAGIADALAESGIACCGPTRAAAALEGSKRFTKEVCEAAGIPTAAWRAFDDAPAARAYVRAHGAPVVIKADGLAAGKGVVVAATLDEALTALDAFMADGRLGDAGRRVVIEECLTGEEISLFALCDGQHAVLLGAAQDHKRVGDGDTGPNTGGMGAVSPPTNFDRRRQLDAMERFILPALGEMARRRTPFRGVLFAGLMLTANGPTLIEYNVRLGDPETQALLPRLQSDFLAALLAACDGELRHFDLRCHDRTSVAVVMAAHGYPGDYARGGAIGGIAQAEAVPGVAVFHAGTAMRDGHLVASGGRVLTVTGTAATLTEARRAAYAGVDAIRFQGVFRRDIGVRALAREHEAS